MDVKLKGVLKNLKENESLVSMILGGLVVAVAASLVISYFRSTNRPQITNESSSTTSAEIADTEDMDGDAFFDTSKEELATVAQEIDKISAEIDKEIDELEQDIEVTTEVESSEGDKEEVVVEETPNVHEEEEIEVMKEHTVIVGENLWKISEKYFDSGYNWTDIAKANSIENPQLIDEGQVLKIPNVEAKEITVVSATRQVDEDSSKTIEGDTYTVIKGDSLWSISLRAYADGYRWVELWEANKEIIAVADQIEIGQELRIPR